MSRARWALALLLLAAVWSMPSAARADGDGRPSANAAGRVVVLFEKSKVAFRAGQFEESAKLLLAAYAIRPEPVFLYNLGRAYEGIGRREDALSAYQRYLAEAREIPDRGAIEQTVARLKQQIEDRNVEERRRAALEAQPPQDIRTAPSRPTIVPWILLGAGAASVGAGAVLGLVANGSHSSAVSEPDGPTAEDKQGQAETFAKAANVCFVAGAAVIVVGTAWFLIERLTTRRTDAALNFSTKGPAAVFGGTF